MLKLIKEVLKTGEATIAYPFQPIEQQPDFRGKPHHDPALCIACGACAIACPPNALTMSTSLDEGTITWQLFVGRCIYCGRCEEVCPTGAILLSPDFELAVMNKADLFEKAGYTLAACPCCGAYFAAQKQLDYVALVLENSGMDPAQLERERSLLALCPECKRKTDAPKVIALHQEVAS
jgi:hydrogenase-4 component H